LTSADFAATAEIIVIFATHNGSNVLPEVLDAYVAARCPSCDWALVAVDNASTDGTRELLSAYEGKLPLLIVDEEVPGKNRALNSAIELIPLIEEKFIVVTDDDALPDDNFLVAWERARRALPSSELFGAPVEPYFKSPAPSWLRRFSGHFAELYAQLDGPPGEIPPERIYGPNMAVRGSVFARGERFNESIGPNSTDGDYPMGSETEFCVRVSRKCQAAPWFVEGPRIRHIVRETQMTKEFVRRRAYRHGRGVAMKERLLTPNSVPPQPRLSSRIRQLARQAASVVWGGNFLWEFHWRRGYDSWSGT
jgi:glycosyltransferase involved in cell wall biosynthesis